LRTITVSVAVPGSVLLPNGTVTWAQFPGSAGNWLKLIFRTARIVWINNRIITVAEHRAENITGNNAANDPPDNPARYCARRPEGRPSLASCYNTCKRIGATRIAIRNRIAAHISIRVRLPTGPPNRILTDESPGLRTVVPIPVVERLPSDDLALQFEAVQQLSDDERAVIREVVESLIIKYQTRRWASARPAPAAKKTAARRGSGASR